MMNCRECEERLERYDELTPAEQSEISEHAAQCETCRPMLANIIAVRQATTIVIKPELRHAAAFTGRVMQAIAAQKQKKPSFGWLFSPIPRLALAVLSAVMIVFLFAEERGPGAPGRTMAVRDPSNAHTELIGEARLNTRSFLENVRASALADDNTLLTLYDCAKQENCDNTFVKNLRMKFIKHQNP